MKLIYSKHALDRALERSITRLPVDLSDARREYQVDGHKTVYSWPSGLRLVVLDNESFVKTVWMVDKKAA